MASRRTFLSLVAGSMATPGLASAQPASQKVALYANVGADLTHYDVDVAGAELIKRATVTLPAAVQYAWPHVSRRYLYVATSSSAPGYGTAGTEHHVTALSIDPASGALTPHGAPIRLPARPIHISADIPSEYLLLAFNNPSAVRVYRINKNFTPGEEVMQPGPIDAGIFAHQVSTRSVPAPNSLRSCTCRRRAGLSTPRPRLAGSRRATVSSICSTPASRSARWRSMSDRSATICCRRRAANIYAAREERGFLYVWRDTIRRRKARPVVAIGAWA